MAKHRGKYGMNPKFWQSKRVFLTGHTGFKGSWLSLLLHSLGAKVSGYALAPNTSPNLFELANVKKHIDASSIGDIRDLENLKRAVLQAEPEFIFHLAAQPLVRYSYEHPIETYETNVLGTVNILETMRSSKTAKVLINITTDKCYENKEWQRGYREEDPLGGYDPYSSSKACSELVTAAYRSSYFNPKEAHHHGKAIATARAGNVIGGGDWAKDRLIPDILTAFHQGEKPIIRYPEAIRPWQHVLEPLCGYLTLAEKCWHEPHVFAESWNFGPYDEDCRTVAWMVNTMNQLWKPELGWQSVDEKVPHEANFLKLDISKAQTRLQWQPRWDLTRAIEATVLWYRNWYAEGDALTLTLNQINQYIQEFEKTYA